MINAIAELGQYEKSNNQKITSFDIWLEDSFDNGKNPNLLLIELEKEDGRWNYRGIGFRENSSELKAKLLYKRHSSRGADKTPTAKVAGSAATAFKQKIAGWFVSNCAKDFLTDQQQELLSKIGEELKNKSEAIVTDIEDKLSITGKKGVVVSLKLIDVDGEKFIGDFDFFSKFITEESKLAYKYSKKSKTYSFSEEKHCSVCKKTKSEVFGFFSALPCYTVDKLGMITGGFQLGDSWKNYPVCLDCALDIEMGIKLMEKELDFSFYGLRYHLIPKTINRNARNEIIEKILEYKKSPKIKDTDRKRLTNVEEDIFDLLIDEENRLCLNLLFYDKPQKGVFKILASIEEVLPSRIKELFDAKDWVDNLCFFKDQINADGKPMYRFNFGVLRTFFPNSKIEGNHDKSFLEMTQKIFNDAPVDYQFVAGRIMACIRRRFAEDNPFRFQVNQGFMLVNFMNVLHLFRDKKKGDRMDRTFFKSFSIETKEDFEDKVILFFDKFSDFFIGDEHRGIFLMGVLTQFLLNIQWQERGAYPFRSRLRGLKMDAGDISHLLPEIIEKLEQYGANYYKPLENLISKLLVSAGSPNHWKMSVDEMNFIFVLGMNLSQSFKIQSDDDQNDTEEEA